MKITSVIFKSFAAVIIFIISSLPIAAANSPEQDVNAEINRTIKTCVSALEQDNSDLSALSDFGYKKSGRNYRKTLQKPQLLSPRTKVYVRPKFKGKYYHCDIEFSPVRRKHEPDLRPALFKHMKQMGYQRIIIKKSNGKSSLGFQKGKTIIEVRGYDVLHAGSSDTHLKFIVKQ